MGVSPYSHEKTPYYQNREKIRVFTCSTFSYFTVVKKEMLSVKSKSDSDIQTVAYDYIAAPWKMQNLFVKLFQIDLWTWLLVRVTTVNLSFSLCSDAVSNAYTELLWYVIM